MATRADQRKFHYIYKITRNDGSGKYYIGMHSTDDLEDGYFGSGQLLWKSIKKHGKEAHSKEILEFLPTREALKLREREIVNEELLGDKQCMNLKLGGEGGWDVNGVHNNKGNARKTGNYGWKQPGDYSSEEYRSAVSKGLKDKYAKDGSWWAGKKHTEEAKEKMRASKIGAQRGSKNSQYGTCWVTNGTPVKIKKELLDEHLAKGYRRGRK
jgi:hypothetical protein